MDDARDPVATRLASADPAVRAAAALELAQVPPRPGSATDRLGLLLERLPAESEPDVVSALLKAIGVLGRPSELALLAQYIDHANPKVRATVIEALWSLNTPVALPLIIPFLSDPDPKVRANAAAVLRSLGPERALRVLQQMLGSPHVWMRCAAATALALFDAKVAVPLLEQTLKDSSPRVQERATLALGRFSRRTLKAVTKGISKEAVRAVLKATSQPNLRRLTRKAEVLKVPLSQPQAAVGEAEALGANPSGRVAQPGTGPAPAGLEPAAPAKSREAELQRVERVIDARDGTALAALVDELTGDEDRFVTARVLSAIGILEEQSFAPVLIAHLAHPDARVASNAVAALTRVGDRTAREQILPLLRSMQPRLRANAVLYCAREPEVDVRAPLEEMIVSADVQTRLSGLFCLAELGREELLPLASLIQWRPEEESLKNTVRARLKQMEKRGVAAAGRVRALVDGASSSPNVNRTPLPAPTPMGTSGRVPTDAAGRSMPGNQRTPMRGANAPGNRSTPGDARADAAGRSMPGNQRDQGKGGTSPMPGAAPMGTSGRVPVDDRPAPDGKLLTDTEGVTGTLVPISRRRWKTFLLVARALATATDVALVGVPLVTGLLVLESLAGGLPALLTPCALAAGLAVFLARDLPGGPGVGKRLLGLAVVAPPKAGVSARIVRQLPIVLIPWGLAELYLATRDGRGQRRTDIRLGLEVVPRGSPMLAHFTILWIVLVAILVAGWAFVTSRPMAQDGLLWSLRHGLRPRPTDGYAGPVDQASANAGDAPTDSGSTSTPSGPAARERWVHPTLGVSVPVPAGWAISASGSAWLQMRPRAGSALTTGELQLSMPGESEAAATPDDWGTEAARRLNAQFEREHLRLSFWSPPSGRSNLGGTAGQLFTGNLHGGQEVALFACSRLPRPLSVSCRVAGEPGLARRLIDGVVRDCSMTPAGADWRVYASPFRKLRLSVPAGWAVARDDRQSLTLRPDSAPDLGWIRLEPVAGTPPTAKARVEATHMKLWKHTGYEVVRASAFSLPGAGAAGLALDLRNRTFTPARFRIAWIGAPASLWTEEWLERDGMNITKGLEEVVRGLKGT